MLRVTLLFFCLQEYHEPGFLKIYPSLNKLRMVDPGKIKCAGIGKIESPCYC